MEETGLIGSFVPGEDAVHGTPNGFIAYEEHPAGNKGLHMNFCFLANVETDQIRPNAEFSEFKWIADVQEAADAPMNVKQILSRIMQPNGNLA